LFQGTTIFERGACIEGVIEDMKNERISKFEITCVKVEENIDLEKI
jgi:hypothetical protein